MTQLLPSPYQTNCFNYTKIGCKSRNDCVEKCNIGMTMKQCNSLPIMTNMDINNDNDIYNYSICTRQYNDNECEEKYKSLDCMNEYFSIKLCSESTFNENCFGKFILENFTINKFNKSLQINELTAVQIEFGDEPDTIYSHSPQQHLVELICFIGGVISLWTGFSVSSLYAYGKKLFMKNNSNQMSKVLIIRKY